MSKNKKVSDKPKLNDIKQLYTLANEFIEIAPWNWMNEQDCFSIKTPYSDERVYCCVFGSEGIEFGINAYIGTDGLMFYTKILTGEAEKNPAFTLEMDAFVLLLEDKEDIEKDSLKCLQKSGVKYSDDKIPNIQRYKPGVFPRNLNANETKIMICIIEQVIEVTKRVIIEPRLLNKKGGKIFTRVLEEKNGEKIWHDEYLEPVEVDAADMILRISPEQMFDLKSECEIIDEEWHYGSFISPHPVKEGNKEPYFPRVVICVSGNNPEMLVDMFLIKANEKDKNIQKHFIDTFNKLGVIPKSVKTKPEKVFFQLATIAQFLNVDFDMKIKLPEIEDAINYLANMPG